MSSARRWTEVDGVEVHWTEVGQGRPLVLLHGLSDSHRTWARVAPALAEGHRVLAPDLPGHGLSGRPDASYRLDWYAHTIARWLDELGVDDADVVGNSFGGGVAQHLLLERPGQVRRLGLVASGGLGREVSFGLRLLSATRLVERIGQPFMGPFTRVGLRTLGAVFDGDEIDWLAWANARPGTARGLSRTVRDVIDWRGQSRHFLDRAHEVAELPPVALFWGARDPVIPFAHGARMAELLDGVALLRFDGGHFPHREHPAAFTQALGAFLSASSLARPRLAGALVGPRRVRPRASWWQRAWRTVVTAVRGLFGSAPRREARVGVS